MNLEFEERDRVSVAQDLQSADEEVRRLAVERVDALPAAQAILALIECLGDPSWRVRKAAVERLVASPQDADVAGALVNALGDGENSGRRNASVEALVSLGRRALPKLFDARASEDVDVRKLVVDALAGIADPLAREPLEEMLDDDDPNVRAAAADALGVIGGAGVPQALLGKATDVAEDQLVRFSAIHALTALEQPIRASELGSVLADPVLGPAGMALLGRADDDEAAIDVLLKGLGSRSLSSREASIRSLLRIVGRAEPDQIEETTRKIREAALACERAVPSALERLPEADLAMRLALIQFLGLVADPSAVVPILRAGSDEALVQVALTTLESLGPIAEKTIDAAWNELDAAARRDACVLLGRTDGREGPARLLSALDDVATEVRMAAALAIGERRLSEALPPLVRRLTEAAIEEDFEAEEEVAAMIDGLIDVAKPIAGSECDATEQAIGLLTACLEGAPESVRLAVATVLGRIGRHQDSPVVAFLLKDPSSAVRRAAVEALARLEPGTAGEPLRLALADESPSVRIAAATALGASQGNRSVDDLERLAADPDSRVRSAAVRSLVGRFAYSDDERCRQAASQVLGAALEDDAPVALSAVEALCEIGGAEAARAEGVLSRPEPELVREAVRCVGTHSEAEGIAALVPLVSHPDWSVRAEAIQALADRRFVRAVPTILRRLDLEQDDFVRRVTLRALNRLESGVG
jgi:HEAT repeat protein